MATTPKKAKPRSPQQRMAARRERLRAQGLRPVQHWVPDLRNPKVRADLRRQAKLMARHPENDAIDAWIEAGVLNGEHLYAADFMIVTSLALLCYRPDLGPELADRSAIRLIDRVLPEPMTALVGRRAG